jgi:hypothetical protein
VRRFATLTLVVATTLWTIVSASPVVALPLSPYLNSNLVQVDQVPGVILDVSPTQVLYLFSSPARLTVKDRASGAVTTMPHVPGRQETYGWLGPHGVVAVSTTTTIDHNAHLYEWRGGSTRIDLGEVNAADSVVLRGSYLIWSNATTLYRRNLDTEQTVVVSTNAGNWSNDVLPNGDVYYWTSAPEYQINRYHNGVSDQLTQDPSTWNIFPVADGTNVVYHKGSPCCTQRYALWLYDGTRHLPLTAPSTYDPTPGIQYQAAGGWTAYVTVIAGREQVWLRGPDGVAHQISDLGGSQPAGRPQIVSVDPAGRVAYSVGQSLYLGVQNQPPVLLASDVGDWSSGRGTGLNFAMSLAGRWYFSVGGTFYVLSDQVGVSLSISFQGHGTVSVAPYGRSCHAACVVPLAAGATVTLTATADLPGWRFTGWRGACSGTAPTCNLRLDANTSVSALFHAADTTAPVITGPVSTPTVGGVVSRDIPVGIPLSTSWTATDPEGPIASTETQVAINGGGFAPVPLAGATTNQVSSTVVQTANYQYRVRATDSHANVSAWSTGTAFTVQTYGPTVLGYGGTWTAHQDPSTWFGVARFTTVPDSAVSMYAAGRAIAIVATTRPQSPRIHISWDDGRSQTTVATASPQLTYRHIVAVVPLRVTRYHVSVSLAPGETQRFEFEGFIVLS